MRKAAKERITKETNIFCEINPNPEAESLIDLPVAFLRHMLELFARFAGIGLVLRGRGDTDIDIHHLNEDLGIVLGQCLDKALGDRRGIRRIGNAYVPMDEALSRVVIDLSGRAYLAFNVFVLRLENEIADYSIEYARQFFLALANHLKATIHIDLLRAKDFHHAMESIFKAFGLALSEAVEIVGGDIPSTKGIVD